jgi:hypothetical protein
MSKNILGGRVLKNVSKGDVLSIANFKIQSHEVQKVGSKDSRSRTQKKLFRNSFAADDIHLREMI